MRTEYMLLSIYNKPRLSFKEVCDCICLTLEGGRSQRAKGTFPVTLSGSPLSADIRDVAVCLDKLREDVTT